MRLLFYLRFVVEAGVASLKLRREEDRLTSTIPQDQAFAFNIRGLSAWRDDLPRR